MEIKQNEATTNRPEGARILDAPFVFTDLEAITEQLVSEKAWEKNDRNGITVFKTDKLTVVVTALKAHAELVEKSIDGLLMLQVLKGKVKVNTSGESIGLVTGNLFNLHECISYSITAEDDSVLLLTTYQ